MTKLKRYKKAELRCYNKQRKALEKQKEELQQGMNAAYEDCVDELVTDLHSKSMAVVNKCIQDAMQQTESTKGTELKRYKKQILRGGLFGEFLDWLNPKYENRHKIIPTVKAGYVRGALEGVTQKIQYEIEMQCTNYIAEWKERVNKAIMRVVENSEIESGAIDVLAMRRIIRAVVNSIETPKIHAQALPSELKRSGKLQGDDAEAFMDAARSYGQDLQSTMNESVKYYVYSVKYNLERQDISTVIVSRYREEIENLERDVQNKEASLDRYNCVFAKLEKISPAELSPIL